MKNKLGKILFTSISFPAVINTVAVLSSCGSSNKEQLVTFTEDYWTAEQKNTVHSLSKMNGSKDLLYLDYTADYKLKEYISNNPNKTSRHQIYNDVLFNGKSTHKLPDPTNSKACTALAVNGADGKQYLARSMDWNYDGTFDMILRTHAHPNSGSFYDTISMVHTTYFYGMYDSVNEPDHAEALLYAPYSDCTDGINSAGLAIAQLDLEYGATKQEKKDSKPYLPYSLLSRVVLDTCPTVEKALEVIQNDYAFYADAYKSDYPGEGTNIHWLLEDKAGNKANVVFEGSDGFDKPKIAITYQPTKIKSFDSHNDKQGCFVCSLEYAKENVMTTKDNLWITNFYINQFEDEDAGKELNLHESEGYYRYYCIQKYLIDEGHSKPTFDQIKYILNMVRYSIDVDIMTRFIAWGKNPLDPEVWENWMSTYSVIYNLTDLSMTVWKFENFDVSYKMSL